MRSDLRNLQKQKDRMLGLKVWQVPLNIQQEAVLILLLCGETRWAQMWVLHWQLQHYTRTLSIPIHPTQALLQQWLRTLQDSPAVRSMQNNLGNPKRVIVDRFLIESLVYEFVRQNSKKGICTPHKEVLSKYCILWSYRPKPPVVTVELQQLLEKRKKRREWCRRFRHKWNILWGMCERSRPQSKDILSRKVVRVVTEIFLLCLYPLMLQRIN